VWTPASTPQVHARVGAAVRRLFSQTQRRDRVRQSRFATQTASPDHCSIIAMNCDSETFSTRAASRETSAKNARAALSSSGPRWTPQQRFTLRPEPHGHGSLRRLSACPSSWHAGRRHPRRWSAALVDQRLARDPDRGLHAGCQEHVAGVEIPAAHVLPDRQHRRGVVSRARRRRRPRRGRLATQRGRRAAHRES
jgi:hypothetical protein